MRSDEAVKEAASLMSERIARDVSFNQRSGLTIIRRIVPQRIRPEEVPGPAEDWLAQGVCEVIDVEKSCDKEASASCIPRVLLG